MPLAEPAGMRALRLLFARSIERRTVVIGLVILGLNLIDAFATLRHLDHGAEELNPLMLALLRGGPVRFLAVKHALASVGVIGIAMHGEVRAARVALWILLPMYALIAAYQLILFLFIP
jgi:Domain of unknown function (DUF5658)